MICRKTFVITLICASSLFSTKVFGYSINFGPSSAVSHTVNEQEKTATGLEDHQHRKEDLSNGLRLGAITETSATGTGGNPFPQSYVNILDYTDTVTRGFVIQKTKDEEPLTVLVNLQAAITGTLRVDPPLIRVTSNQFAVATLGVPGVEILQGTDVVLRASLSSDATTGTNFVLPINESASSQGSLGVGVPYTLRLQLTTRAESSFNDANGDGLPDATSARADFLNSLTGTVSVASTPEPSTILGLTSVLGFAGFLKKRTIKK